MRVSYPNFSIHVSIFVVLRWGPAECVQRLNLKFAKYICTMCIFCKNHKGGGVPSPEGLQLNPPPLSQTWHGVSDPKRKNQNANLSLQITNPPKTPPAPLRIPPGRSKTCTELFLLFCKNNSQCRAGSQKSMPDGHGCEYALKMEASSCLFLCVSCFKSLFASFFFKIVVPGWAGTTFLQNDFKRS